MSEKQQHGVTAYANGTCRCAKLCKPAWAAYMRNRRRTKTGARRTRTRSHVARRSYYQDKESPVGIALTRLSKQILDRAEARAGENVDDIVERAIRTLGVDGLTESAA